MEEGFSHVHVIKSPSNIFCVCLVALVLTQEIERTPENKLFCHKHFDIFLCRSFRLWHTETAIMLSWCGSIIQCLPGSAMGRKIPQHFIFRQTDIHRTGFHESRAILLNLRILFSRRCLKWHAYSNKLITKWWLHECLSCYISDPFRTVVTLS